MKIINELLVVEGKHDSANLKRYFVVDTKETQGANIKRKIIEELKKQAETRQIVIFTDPDASGNYIRETLSREIPGCLHAYLRSDDCRDKAKVGIEHASKEVLEAALNTIISYKESSGSLTLADLTELNLCGNTQARKNRDKISRKYHIGDCNAKSLLKRLNALNIAKEELIESLKDE